MAKVTVDDDEEYVPSAGLEKILAGVSKTELSQIFRIHHRTLTQRMLHVKPAGKRGSKPYYFVHEVAPYLVKPAGDFEEYIKNANHMDLPKALTKEFWQGQRLKQQYMQAAGDLWPTQKVVEKVSTLVKLTAMNARLFTDAVERQVELTDRQKSILTGLVDGMLNDLHRAVVENFSKPQPGDERAPDPSLEVTDDEL